MLKSAAYDQLSPAQSASDIAGCERALAELIATICFCIISVLQIEAKICLARHLHDLVVAMRALRARHAELAGKTLPVSIPRTTAGGESTTTPGSDEELLTFLGAKARLADQALRRSRRKIHPLWDEPGCRAVAEAARAIRRIRRQSLQRPRGLAPATPHARFALDLVLPDMPGRPPGFRIMPVVPRPQDDTPPAALKAALLHHLIMSTEIPTIEHCASLLLLAGDSMPWSFVEDMARQCWDEARHAEIFLGMLIHLGFPLGAFPVELSLWRMTRGQDLATRLAIHQRIGEWLALDAAEMWAQRFEESGDIETARAMAYVAADELQHVSYGNKWLRHLLPNQEALDRVHVSAEAIRAREGGLLSRDAPFPVNRVSCSRGGFRPQEIAAFVGERDGAIRGRTPDSRLREQQDRHEQ